MKLIEVSPISSKVSKDSLTYFSAKEILPGDIVEVEVRKKIFDALVIGVRKVSDLKQEIKTATYGFKKIESVKGEARFSKEFFESCEKTKKFFLGNLGQIVSYFIPKLFLKNYESLPKLRKRAVGSSVCYIVPTALSAEKLSDQLLKSDFNRILVLHGKLRPKKLLETYKEILESKDPVQVVTTPNFVFVPRHDLGKIVVTQENSSSYRSIKRPYFDIRFFLNEFAKKTKIDIEFSGTPITFETLTNHNLKPDKTGTLKINLVDMSDKENHHGKSFIFSKKVFEEISKSDKTFLFSLRKGLGSTVICHDCGQILKDGDVALNLKIKNDVRVLWNPLTKETLDPKTRCQNCESWNFDTLGIGADTVAEEAKKLFGKKNIFQINSDVTKTDKKVRETIAKFYETPNSILIGTELALPYLEKIVDVSVIITLDSLLSIPSYKIHEKILSIGTTAMKLGKKNFFQTRDKDNIAIDTLMTGNLKKFYDFEKTMRERFGVPPFGNIIRISRTSNKDDFDRNVQPLISDLQNWQPIVRRTKRGKVFETIIILKLDKKTWNEDSQDQLLTSYLLPLTPDWQIRVNPESLF